MNLYDTLIKSANQFPVKIAAIDEKYQYTYSELYEYSKKIESQLRTFKKNGNNSDRLKAILFLQDSIDFISAFYAVNLAGMIVVPVSPQAKDLKLSEVLNHSQAQVIITTQKLFDSIEVMSFSNGSSLKEILILDGFLNDSNLKKIGINVQELNQCCDKANEKPHEEWMDDEVVGLFYLSDKQGKPKGIMLSTKNIMTNMEAIIEYLKMNEKDKLLILKSMTLIGTITGEILASIAVSATIVLTKGIIHAGIILKAIDEHKITGFFAMPVMLHQIVEYNRKEKYSLKSLRYIQTGAAKLDKQDVEQFMSYYSGVDFYYIYGLSEASPRVLFLGPEDILRKAGSVGKPVKYCSVVILNENKEPVQVDEIGELYVKGSNVMLGYYQAQKLNEEVLTDYGLKTGDLAYIDDEGYVYLSGRVDNMINQGGVHVYPREIEKIISQHKKVKEVKVEGVPDLLLGQKIKVIVTSYENTNLTPEEIYGFCYAHMENIKIPKIIEVK